MNKNSLVRKIMALILVIFMVFGLGQNSIVRADEGDSVIPTDENGNVIAEAEEGDPVTYNAEDDFNVQSTADDNSETGTEKEEDGSADTENDKESEEKNKSVIESENESDPITDEENNIDADITVTIDNIDISEEERLNDEESDITLLTEETVIGDNVNDGVKKEEKYKESEDYSYRLLIGTVNEKIFRDKDIIISKYNDIYMLGFLTEEERAEAYKYYMSTADIVEYDEEIMTIADGIDDKEVDDEETESDNGSAQDALTILNEILEEEDVVPETDKELITIAVIDTGAPDSISDRVSVIGDDAGDDNGHGSNIIKEIIGINPNAEIISVKAFDNKGKAKPSDVYAAIMYAVSRKVSIINLSASSILSEDSDVIREAVRAASDEGIIFVGAAGNNGRDVKYFIPGDIDEAVVAGAADEKGIKLPTSNFGDKVDYYVTADSTSASAAKLTGRLSLGLNIKPESYEDIFLPKDVKFSDNDTSDPGSEEVVVSYTPYDDVTTLSNKNRGSSWDKYFFKTTSANDNPLIHLEKNLDIYNANTGYGNQVTQNNKYLQTSYYYGAPEDENFAKVHPGYFERDGGGGLNCTAFPVWVLRNMGVGADTISATIGYGDLGSIYSLFRWTNWIRDRVIDGQMIMYNYSSIDDMLKDGRVKKGDLIIFEPTISGTYDSEGQRIDHHIGFYWGDSVKENLFWHSTNAEWYEEYGEDLYKGAADHEGNKITGLQPKTKYSRVWMLPGSDFEYYMYFEKTSEDGSSMDGIEYTVTNSRTGKILCTAVLDEKGHLKSLKNVTADDHFKVERKIVANTAYLKVTERLDDSRIQNWDVTLNISVEESYVPASLNLVRNYGTAEFKIKNDFSNAQKLSKEENNIFHNLRGKGLIEIYKVDEAGNPLPGAVFRVKQGNRIVADVRTITDRDKQGYCILAGLEPGKYTIQEIKAPTGYFIDNTVYEVTIDTSGTFSYNGVYYGYVYDLSAYKEFNDDLAAMTAWKDTDYFRHFLSNGMKEYRTASYNMGGYEYRKKYSDLDKAFGNEYQKYYLHYISNGIREMRMGMKDDYYSGLAAGKVHHNNSAAVMVKAGNRKIENYVSIRKKSSSISCTNGNPNYDLAGTAYGLFASYDDAENNRNVIHTFTIKSDGSSDVWDIPSDKMKINASGELEETTFFLKELKAGKGYKLNTDIVTVNVKPGNTKNSPAIINVEDSPLLNKGSIVINKNDMDGTSAPEGTGTLEGAQFVISYYAVDTEKDYTAEQLNVIPASAEWKIETRYDETTNEYRAELGKDWLIGSESSTFYYEDGKDEPVIPFGYLVIKEVKAPEGYEVSGVRFKYSDTSYDADDVFVAKVNKTGSISVEGRDISEQISVEDIPIRGDIILSKKDIDGNAMKDVEFEITSKSTGETHKLITDENGVIDSRKSGLWFGVKKDGTVTDKIDGVGALPCGEYILRELRCDANAGKILETPFSFTVAESTVYRIKDSGSESDDIINVDIPKIGTTASVSGAASRFLPENAETSVTDTVTYSGLRADTEYTLVGRIAIINDKGDISFYQKDGEEYKVIKQFKTSEKYQKSKYEISGQETMSFDVDTTGMEGCRIVIFEKLYLGKDISEKDEDAIQYEDNPGIFPIIHEDASCYEQTLYIPHIKTTASFESEEEELKTLEINLADFDISKPLIINDVVSYSGLMPGDYEIRGVIMDRDTGKIYESSGDKSMSVKECSITEINGKADISFELLLPDIKESRELNLVVFEELYYVGNEKKLVAEHKDLNSEDQTVKLIFKEESDKPGKPQEPDKPTEPQTPESPDYPVPSNPPTTYVAPPDSPGTPNKPPAPNTSDEVPIDIIVIGTILSAVGFLAVRKNRKKRKEQ